MAGFDNDVMYANNVDFTGGSPVVGQMTMNGELLIGATVAPFIRANTLTAGSGISITNGAGTITITNTGGGGGGGGATSLSGNLGSAPNIAGVINVIGSTGLTTTGDGVQTLTITPTGNLLALQGLSGTGYVVHTGANTFVERTFVAGSGITLTNASGVAGATTITAGATVPTTFTEDAGTATPAANNINILGTAAQGISTSGAGSTVTLTASDATSAQKGVAKFDVTNFTVTAGNVTSNAITVTAGTGLTTGGSVNLGGSVTLALDIPVTVPHGGTGRTTLTSHGVLLGEGASAVNITAAGTDGQVLIAGTGLDPAFATIAGTQGVTLTTGANTLSIGLVNVPNSALANSSITINGGAGISVVGSPVSLGGTVTISQSGTVITQFNTDSGTAIPVGNNVNLFGTSAQGLSTSASGSTVTFTNANATTTTKGVASFNTNDFTVSSGAVSLQGGIGKSLTPDEGGAVSFISGTINVKGIVDGTTTAQVTMTHNQAGNLTIEDRSFLTPFVVDSSTTIGVRGTFSTIASAISAAVSGQTIFIRPGSYTEDLVLKAGVNLAAFSADAYTGNVIITGKCSFSSAGTVSLSGLQLVTNGDYALAITGANASIVNVVGCYIKATSHSAVNYTASNGSSNLNFYNCAGDITTSATAFWTCTGSAGAVTFFNCAITNSAASTTASTTSACTVYIYNSILYFVLSATSSGNYIIDNCTFQTGALNTTLVTTSGSGKTSIFNTSMFSGTASILSVGSGGSIIVFTNNEVYSTNANVITGVGEIRYGNITYLDGSSSTINTTTQTPLSTGPVIQLAGNPQILSGSGSPNGVITAPKGSLFLRTDGTTINNRAYINTNAGTTWTALTTIA